MKSSGNLFATVRTFLMLALIFLGSLILTGIIGAPIITILSYFVISYRSKLKALEKRQPGSQATPAYIDSPAPPTSTDA
jgi:hypothetical protein